MAVQNDFSKGSILSHMARIALPMTLAQFVNILYNIIDRVFIGRIPDHATEALTGLGVAFPICTLAIAFANLVGMGFIIEKAFQNGRKTLEERGVRVESLAIIEDLSNCQITIKD